MFIHLHESEQKPCDNCGQTGTILLLFALHADRTVNLCKTCIREVIPAFSMVAKKLSLNESRSTENGSRLLTLKGLAELLSVHECTIYRQLKAGRIPFVRVGGEYRFNPSLVIARLTDQTRKAGFLRPRLQERRRARRVRTLKLVPARSDASVKLQTADSGRVSALHSDDVVFTPRTSGDSAA